MRETSPGDPIRVRAERSEDQGFIFALHAVAFSGVGEARLVDRLRRETSPFVSLVATERVSARGGEASERVLGHISFSPVRVDSPAGTWDATGLAPLAVAPGWQRHGVGGRLVRAGLDACRAIGRDVVFVLGHATYYPRFGFVRADAHGCKYEGGEAFSRSFFVAESTPGALAGRRGIVHFAPAFRDL